MGGVRREPWAGGWLAWGVVGDAVVTYEDVVAGGWCMCILRDRWVLTLLFSIGLSFSAVDGGERMAEIAHKPKGEGERTATGESIAREKREKGTGSAEGY